MKIAIVAITHGGAELARRLGEGLLEAEVFLSAKYHQKDNSHYFTEPLAELLPRLFVKVEQLICIMASCALLYDAQVNGKLVDDRSKTGEVRRLLDEAAVSLKLFQEYHDDFLRSQGKEAGAVG